MGLSYYFFEKVKISDVKEKTDLSVEMVSYDFNNTKLCIISKGDVFARAVSTNIGSKFDGVETFDTLWSGIERAEPLAEEIKTKLGIEYVDENEWMEKSRIVK